MLFKRPTSFNKQIKSPTAIFISGSLRSEIHLELQFLVTTLLDTNDNAIARIFISYSDKLTFFILRLFQIDMAKLITFHLLEAH